jgi:hypothetical protein
MGLRLADIGENCTTSQGLGAGLASACLWGNRGLLGAALKALYGARWCAERRRDLGSSEPWAATACGRLGGDNVHQWVTPSAGASTSCARSSTAFAKALCSN